MARIVLISPYLKGGQNAAKLAQRTRYVATRPGVELLADERSTLPATKKQQDFITRLLKSFPSCWELIEYEEYLEHPTQGNASAFIQQVYTVEHFLTQYIHSPFERKGWQLFTCFQIMFKFLENPGTTEPGPSNHDGIYSILFKTLFGTLWSTDVTVSDNGDTHSRIFLDFSNQGPVGFTGIHLCTGTSVEGQGFNSAVL